MLNAMNSSSRHPSASLALSALVGWLALVIVWAGYVFAVPHGPHFAPEVGPFGAFIVFGLVYSTFYLLDFILIVVPYFLFFHRRIHPGIVLRGILGAALFCLSVPCWFFACSTDRTDMFFCMAFAAVAGAASFVVLRPSTFTANVA